MVAYYIRVSNACLLYHELLEKNLFVVIHGYALDHVIAILLFHW